MKNNGIECAAQHGLGVVVGCRQRLTAVATLDTGVAPLDEYTNGARYLLTCATLRDLE